MQRLGNDQCRPRIVSHACACNAWVTIDVAIVLLVMLLHAMLGRRLMSPLHWQSCCCMQCLGDDCRRPRIGNHAMTCNAWVTIDVAFVLVHAMACNAWVTIAVALALVIML